MLIHVQKVIIEMLLRHLAKPNNLALESLLDLCAQLGRDLLDDFYVYFPDVFKV